MRTRSRHGGFGPAVLGAVLMALVSGCASADGPVNLTSADANAGNALPAIVAVGRNALKDVHPDTDNSCGDPTASLAPIGDDANSPWFQHVKQRGKLLAGVDDSTYLFGFRDPKSSELQGFDIEIAHDLAQRIFGDPGKVQFLEITTPQRVTALQRFDVDVVVRTFTISCARRNDVLFSSPYFVAHQRLLVDSASPANNLADLVGQRVCATQGSDSLSRIAQHKAVPVSVANWSDCLVLLQQNQVAGISTDDTILAGMHAQDPKTKIVGPNLGDEPYGVAVNKSNPDFVRYINSALDDIKSNQWQQAYARWLTNALGPSPGPPGSNYKG